MKVKINVTQRDIELGKKKSCEGCPHGIAIKRRLICELQVLVGHGNVFIWRHGWPLDFKIPTPQMVSLWMTNFDNYRFVEPIRYFLDIPVRYLRAGKGPQ